MPSGLSCGPSGATSGPAWCVSTELHRNRERAYFSLTEVVPGQSGGTASVPDSFWALGGFYGLADATGLQYLVRKNVEWLVNAVPSGASGVCGNPNTATAATTTYPRQDHMSQGACVRVKGYIADNWIQNDKACKSLSCTFNDPNVPCRYRAEATAQAKAIRQLAATRGDTTYSRVQWEYGPGPDAVYAPDVSQPNCDPCEAPSSTSSRPLWRIDIVADDHDAFEVKRWDSSTSLPFRATSHSPFVQDMHSQFSNEAQSAIVEYIVDKLLQANRTYRIDFISPDGVDEQVYQGPADATGSIDATVTTPVWMGHGDWGTLVVADATTGQVVSTVYVTSDC